MACEALCYQPLSLPDGVTGFHTTGEEPMPTPNPNPLAAAIAACTIPPRPRPNDEALRAEVAQRLAEKWHQHDSGESIEQYAADLQNCLKYLGNYSADGYQLGCRLEDKCGYEMDVETFNVLDNVVNITFDVVKKHTREWVNTHQLVAPFPHAARVQWRAAEWRDYEHGTLHLIDGERYSETAESPVIVDGDPHGRRIVAWELLEAETETV